METMGRSGIVGLWILGCPNRIGQVADDERSLKYRGLERMSFLCMASSGCVGAQLRQSEVIQPYTAL